MFGTRVSLVDLVSLRFDLSMRRNREPATGAIMFRSASRGSDFVRPTRRNGIKSLANVSYKLARIVLMFVKIFSKLSVFEGVVTGGCQAGFEVPAGNCIF